MFGFLKNLLGKPVATPANNPGSRAPGSASGAPSNGTHRYPTTTPSNGGSSNGNGYRPQGVGVEVSVRNILTNLPLELQAKVTNPEVGELTISVPLERILPQLSHGAVKISYSELCSAAPQVFIPSPDLEATLVALPLGEILSRINPALIKRRRVQKQITVPSDISSPFDSKGRHAGNAGEESQPHIAAAESAPRVSDTALRRQNPLRPTTPMSGRGGMTSTPAGPQPPGITFSPPKLTPPNRPLQNQPPEQPKPPLSMPSAAKPLGSTPLPQPPKSPAPISFSQAPRPSGSIPLPPTGAKPPAPIPPSAPVPLPKSQPDTHPEAATPTQNGNCLVIGLTALAEGWPEPIRKEIVQSNLVDSKVALPYEVAERALRQGRMTFSWKTLRGWIKPAPSGPSLNEAANVELPLKVVAPLFLAKRAECKPKNKVEIDENIPNLFFGFPQSEPAVPVAAATAKPADTNFYVWDDKADVVCENGDGAPVGPSLGTKFVSKYATPNEIVSRAAALDGVAGALIALPDGLLVASRIPGDFNADTLAAFLPQIFGKVSQCTKELRMGDLNNLNFTVGNVPWKIFRVNAIFFAAFGRAAEPLPTAQLAALASELDHKPK